MLLDREEYAESDAIMDAVTPPFAPKKSGWWERHRELNDVT